MTSEERSLLRKAATDPKGQVAIKRAQQTWHPDRDRLDILARCGHLLPLGERMGPHLGGTFAQPGGLSEGGLNHPATDPGPRRDFIVIDAAGTLAVLADLIPDDPKDRQLADGEPARQSRRHRGVRWGCGRPMR